MSLFRQLIGAALNIAAAVTGNWWYFAASVAASAVDYRNQKRRMERDSRDAYNAAQRDRQVMLDLQPDAPRTLVLGRARTVEGVRRRWTSGTNSERLTLIVSFAGHEIDGFETFYFDDIPLTLDGNGWVQTAPWQKSDLISEQQEVALGVGGSATVTLAGNVVAGTVSAWVNQSEPESGRQNAPLSVSMSGNIATITGGIVGEAANIVWQRTAGQSLARIRTYRGTPTQNVGGDLAAEYPGKITSTDRFAGIALAVVDLVFDPDVYPQGIPNITALLRGARVLDPRTGNTAWTENPAVLAYHYARHAHGWAVPAGDIRTADITAAADACDVSTAFTLRLPDTTTTTVTLPRYRCGLVVPLDAEPRAVWDDIMATMAGRWGWAGGTLRLRAGTAAAPAWTLDDSVVALRLDAGTGSPDDEPVLRVAGGTPRDRRVTRVTGTCTHPAERWQVLPFPAIEDPVLIARDGYPLPLEVRLAGVNHPAHAQHLGSILIREAQAGLRMDATCNVIAWPVELFDVAAVTLPRLGMTAKPMEVVGWTWSPDSGVELQLAEISSAIFTPLAELRGLDPAPNTGLPPPWQVPVPTGLALSTSAELAADGAVVAQVLAEWDPIPSQAVQQGGWVEVQWRYVDSDVAPAIVRADSLTAHTLRNLLPGRAVAVAVRSVSALPVRSAWCAQRAVLTAGDDGAPAAVTGLAATSVPGGQRVTWNECPAADYAETEVRHGASWAAGTRIYTGLATFFVWAPPAPGSITLWAVHRDRSGNESTPASVTVTHTDVSGGAALLTLSQSNFAFVFADAAATTSGTGAITFTAALQNLSGTVSFSATAFTADGTNLGPVTLSGTGNTRTMSAAQFVTYAGTRYVTVTASLSGSSDSATVLRVDQGSSALVAALTNEAHAVPADSAGTVTSFAQSGTIIAVAEGTNVLIYDGVGTAAGRWTVSASGTNITPGAISASGSNAQTANASAMTADVASIAFAITGRTLTGAAFGLSKVQRLTKARAGATGSTGATGATGPAGSTGASRFLAYIAAANSSATPATPGNTTNGATPAGWSATPVTLTGTQAQFQTDGTQPAGSTTTTWSTPYLSYFRVAQLSAIAADLGSITAGTVTGATIRTAASGQRVFMNAGGLFTADASGNTVASMGTGSAAAAMYVDIPSASPVMVGLYANSEKNTARAIEARHGGSGVAVFARSIGGEAIEAECFNSGSAVTLAGDVYAVHARGSLPSRFEHQIQSTVSTGTAPFTVASTTRVANLNVATAGWADGASAASTVGGESNTNWARSIGAQRAEIGNTTVGAATASFNPNNKPGAASTNVWLEVRHGGSTFWVPAWPNS
jgi:hypothetical protein